MSGSLKTQKTEEDPRRYLSTIEDERQREDSLRILELMEETSGEKPAMWGDSIIGFGSYRYTYASGRSGDWFRVGFAPRQKNISLYFLDGCFSYEKTEESQEILSRLGKHSSSKACLYIKRLSDIDVAVLRELVQYSLSRSAIGETEVT